VFALDYWDVILGYRERGGYQSMLSPNVNDDVVWLAWAPLDVRETPDTDRIRNALWPGAEPGRRPPEVRLVRAAPLQGEAAS
jgi:hypothetical protein